MLHTPGMPLFVSDFLCLAAFSLFGHCGGNTYYGVVGPCGGHTNDYHFHRGFSCLYAESGGHSTRLGWVVSCCFLIILILTDFL